MTRFKAILDVSVTVTIGMAAVLLVWRAWTAPVEPDVDVRRPPAPVQDVASSGLRTSIGDAPRLGTNGASAVLIEYSDFECPFCARYASETFDSIQEEFVSTGKLQYVFRNFPIQRIHPSAVKAAHAAQCAHHQGKFMEMRTHLFGVQKTLGQLDWTQAAAQVQLEPGDFDACLAGADTSGLRREMDEASRLGVVSTPTFLLGTLSDKGQVRILVRMTGAQKFALFKEQIERSIGAIHANRGG
jgi:protein-disulfide isomerase